MKRKRDLRTDKKAFKGTTPSPKEKWTRSLVNMTGKLTRRRCIERFFSESLRPPWFEGKFGVVWKNVGFKADSHDNLCVRHKGWLLNRW